MKRIESTHILARIVDAKRQRLERTKMRVPEENRGQTGRLPFFFHENSKRPVWPRFSPEGAIDTGAAFRRLQLLREMSQ